MDNKQIREIYDSRPKINTIITWMVIIAVVSYAFYVSTVLDGPNVPEGGVQIAKNILDGILHPNLELLVSPEPAENVFYLLFETIAIAFLGTLIGSILAIIPSFLAARNITGKYISAIMRFLLNAIRTVPALIYALMLVRVTGLNAFAGVMTFSITSIGMISKLYIESIEELDKGILESMTASGATTFQKIRFGVIPQIQSQFLSTSIYRFEINVRDASTLGIVGAGGIGTPLILAISESRYNDVGAYLFGLIILVVVIEFLSTKIRNKLING